MSKRARKAALGRLHDALFGEGATREDFTGTHTVTPSERAGHLFDRARFLRGLADGGMRPRVHRKEAERLEREAAGLDPFTRTVGALSRCPGGFRMPSAGALAAQNGVTDAD